MQAANAFRRVFGWDAAKSDAETRNHWKGADALSADAANSREVRRVCVSRSRYERDNNPIYAGIVRTVANDVVGVGPMLQVLSREEDDGSELSPEQARRVERAWDTWSKAVDLPGKLLVMVQATLVDGESFGLLITNPNLTAAVKLDLLPIECDRVTTPTLSYVSEMAVDGIEFDDFGRPVMYHVLKQHPGSASLTITQAHDRIEARFTVHLFHPDRPEQHRGVPEFISSLPLGAYMRRFTLATVSAAELLALLTVMFETDATPDDASETELPFAEQEIVRGMGMHLPAGVKANALEAKQPAADYSAFRMSNIGDFARPRSVPRNIAACDSSSYNYASGRLDHQTYDLQNVIDRDRLRAMVIDRLFSEFFLELQTSEGFADLAGRAPSGVPHEWIWHGREHVDPAKEANATETELRNNTTTLAAVYARKRRNWETELRQRAREVALARELKLPEPIQANGSPAPAQQGEDDQ